MVAVGGGMATDVGDVLVTLVDVGGDVVVDEIRLDDEDRSLNDCGGVDEHVMTGAYLQRWHQSHYHHYKDDA